VVLVGDAELDEGSNSEAIEFAAAAGLSALTVVAVDNSSATWPWRGGLETRFEVTSGIPFDNPAATRLRLIDLFTGWDARFTALIAGCDDRIRPWSITTLPVGLT
jgi:hypothetical protein